MSQVIPDKQDEETTLGWDGMAVCVCVRGDDRTLIKKRSGRRTKFKVVGLFSSPSHGQ